MKSVARMGLQPGMEIGEAVYSYHGELICPANTIVDANLIAKLACYSIMCVEIKEPADYAVTRFERIRISPAFKNFESVYRNNLNAYKYMIDDFLQNDHMLNFNYLLKIHDNIRACTKTGEELLNMLYYMLPTEDDLTYAHCLNAALISNVFSYWLGLPKEDTKIITLCGFVYDIGKLKLPNSLLWTPGRLSNDEYTRMQTHTILGYDLLKNKDIDQHIINATLMHHERCDGSGYPNHIKDSEIDIYAKYMGIVDSYEAMTSARTYRPSLNPFQVIKTFTDSGLDRYCAPIITLILQHIANSQMGARVALSDGTLADVILINTKPLDRPLVKLVESGELLDLSKMNQLDIVSTL